MRLPRRRTVRLSAALLLAVVAAVPWFFVPKSRITQANYDRICYNDMNVEDVVAVLGNNSERIQRVPSFKGLIRHYRGNEVTFGRRWCDGPNWINVFFVNGKVIAVQSHFVSTWETLTWYAKRGAAKIGVKWD
jgi:hypothetical protein